MSDRCSDTSGGSSAVVTAGTFNATIQHASTEMKYKHPGRTIGVPQVRETRAGDPSCGGEKGIVADTSPGRAVEPDGNHPLRGRSSAVGKDGFSAAGHESDRKEPKR